MAKNIDEIIKTKLYEAKRDLYQESFERGVKASQLQILRDLLAEVEKIQNTHGDIEVLKDLINQKISKLADDTSVESLEGK